MIAPFTYFFVWFNCNNSRVIYFVVNCSSHEIWVITTFDISNVHSGNMWKFYMLMSCKISTIFIYFLIKWKYIWHYESLWTWWQGIFGEIYQQIRRSKTFSFILCLHNVYRILKQLRRDNRGDLWNFDEKFFAQSYDVTCQNLTSDLPHYYSYEIKLVGIQMISISFAIGQKYTTLVTFNMKRSFVLMFKYISRYMIVYLKISITNYD